MARRTPEDRLEQLVECATRIFIEQGYAHTQMADVAAALGVAKGTVYLSVESKEALFDLVARYADAPGPSRRSRGSRSGRPDPAPPSGTCASSSPRAGFHTR